MRQRAQNYPTPIVGSLNGLITKAHARLVACGFGQRYAVDYFETFAATPAMSSIKLVMAVAVQEGWPLYHFDVSSFSDIPAAVSADLGPVREEEPAHELHLRCPA